MDKQEFSPNHQISDQLLEVVDARNKPLGAIQGSLVHRQHLAHRAVYVLIFDNENKVYLQKRSTHKNIYPGRWDLSVRVHPLLDESLEDAALRGLQTELQIHPERLSILTTLPSCPETGHEFVTILAVNRPPSPPRPNHIDAEDGQYFSHDEIGCMVKEFRELLTPNLVTIWERGLTQVPA